MKTGELRQGDVIEVLEMHFPGHEVWVRATIMRITDARLDVLMQAGENRGKFLALEPDRRNQTWRA